MMEKRIRAALIPVVTVFAFMAMCFVSIAGNQTLNPPVTCYEGDEKSNYEMKNGVSTFSYGSASIGKFQVTGDISQESTYNGVKAYGVNNNNISFGYVYANSHQNGNKDDWNLLSDLGTKMAGMDLGFGKSIGTGAVVIQKSTDGINWQNVDNGIYCDFFKKNTSGKNDLYKTTEEEIIAGTYYRVLVAYQMQKRIADELIDKYEKKRFLEVYQFYICSDRNDVKLRDLDNGNELSSNAAVANGFFVDMNGSSASVTIAKSGEAAYKAGVGTCKTDQGKYTVSITTVLGTSYQCNVEVKNGTSLALINPDVYESKDKSGYTEDTRINNGVTGFGMASYTRLWLGTEYGCAPKHITENGIDKYGVKGDSLSLYLQLNEKPNSLKNGWEITYDKWGSKSNENVNGIHVGEVGKGVLIIQHSTDGQHWSDVDAGRYANGLYTTDFATHYRANENILIYTPDGNMILKGLYLRVYYAYEAYQASSKTYKNYIEKYEFYLCSNELDAVTFHNMSLDGQIEKTYGDENESVVDVYKKAETMLSESCTLTGFRVDLSSNPTVDYEVYLNGNKVDKHWNGEYTDPGRYLIKLVSAVGDKKEVTLYVDKNNEIQALDTYFKCSGENEGALFIYGKRIYAENQYPVYEAGKTYYHIEAIGSEYLPVSGVITNKTQNTEITIDGNSMVKNGRLDEAGDYEAVFTTKIVVDGQESSGDYYTFTFHFSLIANGTAPGPKINQALLEEYSHKTVCDSNPIYYGLTYQSRRSGRITQAFASRDEAWEFAYQFERSMVETQDDGSYLYTGATFIEQKDDYESDQAMELTSAMNESSESAVQRLYFDMSDPSKYTTLDQNVIDSVEDLRDLALFRSVTVFAKGTDARDELTDLGGALPIINDKPYRYVIPDIENQECNIDEGTVDFEFIRDKYGCDSDNITIRDSEGKVYAIEYNKSVGQQLAAAGCPTGIVSIVEQTTYGDIAQYDAVYISGEDNTGVVTVIYHKDGEEKELKVDMNSANDTIIDADAFYVADYTDSLDPYGLLLVKKPDGSKEYCSANDIFKDAWVTAGEYEVSSINRLGNKFTFRVRISDSDYSMVTFEGMGTEDARSIITQYGERGIVLPELHRDGYSFEGYVDLNGNTYEELIDEIKFKGDFVLKPVWIPNKCEVVLLNYDNTELKRETVDYDTMYMLPDLDPGDGYEYLGWIRENETVTGEVLVNHKEMVFVMKVRNLATGGL